MKFFYALALLLSTTSQVSAQSLADRAARIFADACLSDQALAIGKGSVAGDGAAATLAASNVLATYDAKGLAQNLAGTPTYKVSSSGKTGRFYCYVASKNLDTSGVLKHYNWLLQTAGQKQRPTYRGPAKFDDDPGRFIEGKRAEFNTERRTLQLELLFFKSARGPVGALAVSIVHLGLDS